MYSTSTLHCVTSKIPYKSKHWVCFLKRSSIAGQNFMFLYSFLFFILRNHELSRRGRDLKERNNGKVTGNCWNPPPLRKPSHHVVRLYWSLRKSKRGCAVERARERERGREESTERKNVRFQKWLVWFYHAQWKGDISVMLYSSLWHFKLIKASNNYADWKDGGWVDTQWANTLNNAAISLSLFLSLFSISSQFLSISLRWPLHLIVKGWVLSLCPLIFCSLRARADFHVL